jgi:hypothetical protein
MKQEKHEQEHNKCKQVSNNILFLTMLWQKYVPKTSVEQTKGNGNLYFYLYPLGI